MLRPLDYYRRPRAIPPGSQRWRSSWSRSPRAARCCVTALGIFGLASFSVNVRTRQIGTRRAVGARKADIVRYFMVENWLVTTMGIVLGRHRPRAVALLPAGSPRRLLLGRRRARVVGDWSVCGLAAGAAGGEDLALCRYPHGVMPGTLQPPAAILHPSHEVSHPGRSARQPDESTVLVIDDNAAVATALEVLLSLHDLRTLRAAASPAEGLAVLAREPVHLVIQDMNFRREATSGEEGVQLFRAIRARQPELPVILLTAWTHLETAVELVKAGAADYLAKPWDDASWRLTRSTTCSTCGARAKVLARRRTTRERRARSALAAIRTARHRVRRASRCSACRRWPARSRTRMCRC